MKRNKKGFTLVELLAVIVVLAIIVAIAVPAFGKISSSIDEKQYENKIKLIEAAALKYSDDTNYVAFYINDLVTNGYLDSDTVVKDSNGNEIPQILDNRDNETVMNCYPISISEDKGIKEATVDDKQAHPDGNGCDMNYLVSANQYFEIYANGEKLTKDSWFSTDSVIVTLRAKSGKTIKDDTIEWFTGQLSTEGTKSPQFTISTSNTYKNEIYRVEVDIVQNGKSKRVETSFIIRTDKIPPYFMKTDKLTTLMSAENFAKAKKYTPQASDNESLYYGSTVFPTYRFNAKDNVLEYIKSEDCPTDKASYEKNKKNQEFIFNANGVYKVCIMDNAGNVSGKLATGQDSKINMDKIDPYPPICDKNAVIKCTNSAGVEFNCSGNNIAASWTSATETITAYIPCTDTPQYNLISTENTNLNTINGGSKCVKNRYAATVKKVNGKYEAVATLKDNAGNEIECKRDDIKINQDGDTPTITLSVDNPTNYQRSHTATIKIEDTGSKLKKGTYRFKYKWSTTAISNCAGINTNDYIEVKVDSDGQQTATAQKAIGGSTGAGKLYVCNVDAIYDTVGNSLGSTLKVENLYLDNTLPTFTVAVANGTTYKQSNNATITLSDNIGLTGGTYTFKYVWSTSNITNCASIPQTNTATISVAQGAKTGQATIPSPTISAPNPTGKGKMYVCNVSNIIDTATNTLSGSSKLVSDNMYLDNKPPKLKVTLCKWSNNDTKPDSCSGLTKYTPGETSNKNIHTEVTVSDADVNHDNPGSIRVTYTTTGKTSIETNKSGRSRNIKANGTSTIQYTACDTLNNCTTGTKYTVIINKNPEFKKIATFHNIYQGPGCNDPVLGYSVVYGYNKPVDVSAYNKKLHKKLKYSEIQADFVCWTETGINYNGTGVVDFGSVKNPTADYIPGHDYTAIPDNSSLVVQVPIGHPESDKWLASRTTKYSNTCLDDAENCKYVWFRLQGNAELHCDGDKVFCDVEVFIK